MAPSLLTADFAAVFQPRSGKYLIAAQAQPKVVLALATPSVVWSVLRRFQAQLTAAKIQASPITPSIRHTEPETHSQYDAHQALIDEANGVQPEPAPVAVARPAILPLRLRVAYCHYVTAPYTPTNDDEEVVIAPPTEFETLFPRAARTTRTARTARLRQVHCAA